MPFYEYYCGKCGKFEIQRGIQEDALNFCPKCGGKVRQLFSPPTVIWRGDFKWMKGNYKIPPALGE